ncbi:MAG: DUF4965 domain-containing protein [Planctomycetota bacterium]|nr:DUF4965 domain-containing protein [Planctomycetota bacterium]
MPPSVGVVAILFALLAATCVAAAESGVPAAALRPPSVPLVACDPYFSIWCPADRLTDTWSVHWTGKVNALQSMIRIDGKPYRIMGPMPKDVPPMPQVGLEVLPTRTIYQFEADGVHVALTFMTAALPQDLEVLARPVTYLTWDVRATDGKSHAVSLHYDNSAELVVNTLEQQVVWSREKIEGLSVLRMGSKDQPVLAKHGDDLRIDWGYLYVAAPQDQATRCAVAPDKPAREGFAAGRTLPDRDDDRMPRPAQEDWPLAAFEFDLGKVDAKGASRWLMLAYDDVYSIQYLGTNLRPYWRRSGAEAPDLLKAAAKDYPALAAKCKAFDEELMADLAKAGGQKYARLCALAYRQCLAANKLAADPGGRPLLFPKENFSNGCIATVDVLYPQGPLFILMSPALTRAMLTPILDYAGSPRWKFPFAPHDLGQYPHANGQVYGGGERTEENQMPVEESGNMILLVAALAQAEGSADFAAKYWPVLERWAEYLKSKGLDPENQLCTDDFAGHLAHNVNLSAKAITALGAHVKLCEMLGKKNEAGAYRKTVQGFAGKWVEMADDGDHFRLAFDKPGTWSQKYNLVWDRLLGLGLFPAEVTRKEIAFYKKVQKPFGLPLDNRQDYTKLDWVVWTASLADSQADFEALVDPAYRFLSATPQRVPMTDWYWTTDARHKGFQARSVVGGVFIKMLYDKDTWKKWAGRAGK